MENFRINEITGEGFKNGYRFKTIYQYDENGFLIKTSSTPKNNTPIYDDKYYETKYIYDDNGLLLLTEDFLNNKKYQYSQYIYSHSNNKILSKIVNFDLENKERKHFIYICDDNLVLKILEFSSDNILKLTLRKSKKIR